MTCSLKFKIIFSRFTFLLMFCFCFVLFCFLFASSFFSSMSLNPLSFQIYLLWSCFVVLFLLSSFVYYFACWSRVIIFIVQYIYSIYLKHLKMYFFLLSIFKKTSLVQLPKSYLKHQWIYFKIVPKYLFYECMS